MIGLCLFVVKRVSIFPLFKGVPRDFVNLSICQLQGVCLQGIIEKSEIPIFLPKRRPADDVSLKYSRHDVVHVIVDDTAPQFLTSQASLAKLNVLASKGNLLDIVSSSLGTFHELVSEHIAV